VRPIKSSVSDSHVKVPHNWDIVFSALDSSVNLVKSTNKRPIKVGSMSVLTVSMTFTSFNPQIILLGFRYTTLVVILNILTGILFLPSDLTLTTLGQTLKTNSFKTTVLNEFVLNAFVLSEVVLNEFVLSEFVLSDVVLSEFVLNEFVLSEVKFFFKCYLYWILYFLNRWNIYLFYLNQYVS
jgi:hypothetical protein